MPAAADPATREAFAAGPCDVPPERRLTAARHMKFALPCRHRGADRRRGTIGCMPGLR